MLGYFIVNIYLCEWVSLIYGIFVVCVGLGDGECVWFGVVSFGVWFIVNEVVELLLEVYLFDFEGDFYG